jgi:hypothetical protein
VAEGAPESVEVARALVTAVLDQPLMKRSLVLEDMLQNESPLALVRAVELADGILRQTTNGNLSRTADVERSPR